MSSERRPFGCSGLEGPSWREESVFVSRQLLQRLPAHCCTHCCVSCLGPAVRLCRSLFNMVQGLPEPCREPCQVWVRGCRVLWGGGAGVARAPLRLIGFLFYFFSSVFFETRSCLRPFFWLRSGRIILFFHLLFVKQLELFWCSTHFIFEWCTFYQRRCIDSIWFYASFIILELVCQRQFINCIYCIYTALLTAREVIKRRHSLFPSLVYMK